MTAHDVPDHSREPLIDIRDLRVSLPTGERDEIDAVRGLSLVVSEGERVGLVSESGSGKSVTGRALAGLLPESPRVRVRGSIRVRGHEMVGAGADDWIAIRRQRVGMVFQDPLTFLNPTMRIGTQVAESLPKAVRRDRAARYEAVREFLALAGLENAGAVARAHPHELSGGMRQRVLIAIAIAKRPDLVLADEPTTALDATVQSRVLRTLDDTVSQMGTSLLLISHDLAVVAGMTDRVYVMYAGRIVEEGPTRRVLDAPEHPYTEALLRSVRSLTDDGGELYSIPPDLRARLREEADHAA